jgi:hypothetical protein
MKPVNPSETITFYENPRFHPLRRRVVQTAWAEKRSRRRYVRKSVLLCGTLHQGQAELDCVVTNISANGARLIAHQSLDKPSLGALKINRCGMFPAEVAWQEGEHVGLRFLDTPDNVIELLRAALPHCKLDYEMTVV